MTGVQALLADVSSDAVALIGTATAVILAVPIAFKGISIGKRVIAKF